jgi:hypothetical protein|tara:strand:+ start:462 stop:596 length:135 start_codon:yes stop_codon:yes gene_type:complete
MHFKPEELNVLLRSIPAKPVTRLLLTVVRVRVTLPLPLPLTLTR